MTGPLRALFSDLKQVLWALLLVYILLGVTGCLFGKRIGFYHAFLVCLAIGLLVTVTFIAIYLVTVFLVAAEYREEIRTHKKGREREPERPGSRF